MPPGRCTSKLDGDGVDLEPAISADIEDLTQRQGCLGQEIGEAYRLAVHCYPLEAKAPPQREKAEQQPATPDQIDTDRRKAGGKKPAVGGRKPAEIENAAEKCRAGHENQRCADPADFGLARRN